MPPLRRGLSRLPYSPRVEPVGVMTATGHWYCPPAGRNTALSLLVLGLWGVGGGLLVGVALVQLLGLLGLPVDTGTGSVLHRTLLP